MEIDKLSLKELTGLAMELGDDLAFLEQLSLDPRVSVQKLYVQLQNRREKTTRELARLTEMTRLERDLWSQGARLVAGVDEVGRGPLAGPVVAGAVILPPGCRIFGLDDSKKLSEKKREALYEEIKQVAVAWGIGMASVEEIDRVNILQATYLAMQRALAGLEQKPQRLLVDALSIPKVNIPQNGIIGGDGLSLSIAAASVMAKVTRDRLMTGLHEVYPDYGFARHKGYGTQEHLEAIQTKGLSSIHRRSFCQQYIGVKTCRNSQD
ncbi:MAG: ribonuclease HII [Clostridia bacterium]|nr:ribonuclease HII [Clostridia bacterium]